MRLYMIGRGNRTPTLHITRDVPGHGTPCPYRFRAPCLRAGTETRPYMHEIPNKSQLPITSSQFLLPYTLFPYTLYQRWITNLTVASMPYQRRG
jgi:hypothetical protein